MPATGLGFELKHVMSFLAVADATSFRAAARLAGVTQPALSQHVRQLEQALGVRLFDRDRRGVILTAAGEALRLGATTGLKQLTDAVDAARRMGGVREKTLIVGQLDYISHAFLPGAINAVKRKLPDVLVELVNMTPKAAVEAAKDGRVDIAFGIGPIDAPELVQREVIRGRWVVWMPESHPLASRDEVPVSMLSAEPLILFRRDINPEVYDGLLVTFRKAGLNARVVHHTAQPQHGQPLVLQGVGLFIVGSYVLTGQTPGVVARPLSGFDTELRIVGAWRAGKRTPALRAFLEGLPTRR